MSEISAFARGRGICFARLRGLFTGTLFFVAACLMMPGIELTGSAYGQVTSAADAGAADDIMFTAEDLGSLVAPIALYPDDLLGLVLSASAEPLQIVQAQRYLDRLDRYPDLKPNENWHTSIIGLLNYPEVVTMMGDDLEWTEQLGLAFIYQEDDVMDAAQQFRAKVQVAGNLESNDQIVVVQDKEVIVIQSAQPEVIYVPSYNPQVVVAPSPAPVIVYSNPYPYYYSPAATFFTGMFVGAAIAYGFNWHNNQHGWHGGNGDINISNNVNVNRTNIDRDKIGLDRGRRDEARDRRQANNLSDSRRRTEGRPSRAQEGLSSGRRGGGRASAGLAPAGRDRTAGARDLSMSRQHGSQRTGQQRRQQAGTFGDYGQGQSAINDRRRGTASRQGRDARPDTSQMSRSQRLGDKSRSSQRQAFGGQRSGSRSSHSANRGSASRESASRGSASRGGGGRSGGRRR